MREGGKERFATLRGGFQASLWGRSLECFLSGFLFQDWMMQDEYFSFTWSMEF